jgi:diguanylate cyclase (GGDEF)-like protein
MKIHPHLQPGRAADTSTLGFATRLALAVAATFAVVGGAGYLVIADQLHDNYLERQVMAQRADVQRLEAVGRSSNAPDSRIDDVLTSIRARPGTLNVQLLDGPRTGNGDISAIDARISAALAQDKSFAGHAAGPGQDHRNFQLVSPIELPGGRAVLAVTRDHAFLDGSVAVVRKALGWVALLALTLGGGVFYLVGGRRLMRSHRIALRRATRDGLTDLPNQRAFQNEFAVAVASAARDGDRLTLAVLDIDDFKLFNDRRGHPHGDALLQRVAGVLREGRVGDRGYRIGGDEFAMLLPDVDDAGARRLATRLSRALTASEAVMSIGVSNLRSGQCPEDLLGEAEAALSEAQHRGQRGVVHFDEIRAHVLIPTSAKNDAVRLLIDEGGLSTVFQPIWDLAGGVLLGVEALTRPGEQYGLSGPAEAFEIAEQMGRTHELDELCVASALRSVPVLPAEVLLFINLSPHTLGLDADGNDWLRDAVEHAGVLPKDVVIEITERVSERTASVVKCLQRLRLQGFRLALDDVGTGNSGLEMLRQVEAEYVKIDRSIVTAASSKPTARAVLMAMATYAAQTGSFVIAEGIEDQETLDFLGTIDQDVWPERIISGGQGYGLGRPTLTLQASPPSLLTPRFASLVSA